MPPPMLQPPLGMLPPVKTMSYRPRSPQTPAISLKEPTIDVGFGMCRACLAIRRKSRLPTGRLERSVLVLRQTGASGSKDDSGDERHLEHDSQPHPQQDMEEKPVSSPKRMAMDSETNISEGGTTTGMKKRRGSVSQGDGMEK